jgi:hypothetical protein
MGVLVKIDWIKYSGFDGRLADIKSRDAVLEPIAISLIRDGQRRRSSSQ